MGIKGVVRNGQIVLNGGATLPEGAEVEVLMPGRLLTPELEQFVGVMKGPKDFARNHDHYIHGTPRKQ